MGVIRNIGLLDTRNITEEMAKEITEIKNIGSIVENNKSRELLVKAKKQNIGLSIKISDEAELIIRNGKLEIDNDFLKYLKNKIAIMINGVVIFKKDIDIDILDEKLEIVNINGKLISPKELSGIVNSRSQINGISIYYDSETTFIEKLYLDNNFLEKIDKSLKFSVCELIAIEELDENLIENNLSNIEILENIIITENNEAKLKNKIQDYYSVEKELIPSYMDKVRFIDEDMSINDRNIKRYNGEYIYCREEVEIYLEEIEEVEKYIKFLFAKKLTTNNKTYEKIKDVLMGDIEIVLVEGRIVKNKGSMILSSKINEKMAIENMGSLTIKDDIEVESFIENIEFIENYGVIKVGEEIEEIVRNKIKNNFGSIKIIGEENKVEKEKEENIIYENLGSLTL